MPNKPTDTEIKKALAQCEIQTYCSDCPYYTKIGCKKHLYQDALDLINRQEEEKKNLEIELQAMRGAANSYKAEVERLKRSNNISQHLLSNAYDSIERLGNFIENIKIEAYKECLDKIEQIDVSMSDGYIAIKKNKFDNLLKEFERKENTIYDD